MIDKWDETLHCPQCHNTGTVSLSQLDDADMPTVLSVSDGFKAVQTEYGPDFRCEICDVPAIP